MDHSPPTALRPQRPAPMRLCPVTVCAVEVEVACCPLINTPICSWPKAPSAVCCRPRARRARSSSC
eukprot:scaffold76046_cov73-Phaeocystis_antarctica.AAC.2